MPGTATSRRRLSGFHALTGHPTRRPPAASAPIRLHLGTLQRPRHSRRAAPTAGATGEGQFIDMGQAEAGAAFPGAGVPRYLREWPDCRRPGNRDAERAPSGVFPVAGVDRWIAIASRPTHSGGISVGWRDGRPPGGGVGSLAARRARKAKSKTALPPGRRPARAPSSKSRCRRARFPHIACWTPTTSSATPARPSRAFPARAPSARSAAPAAVGERAASGLSRSPPGGRACALVRDRQRTGAARGAELRRGAGPGAHRRRNHAVKLGITPWTSVTGARPGSPPG